MMKFRMAAVSLVLIGLGAYGASLAAPQADHGKSAGYPDAARIRLRKSRNPRPNPRLSRWETTWSSPLIC